MNRRKRWTTRLRSSPRTGTRRVRRAPSSRPLLLGGNLEIDPRSLALTTALTSTLVLADLLAPRPAAAQVVNIVGSTSPETVVNGDPCASPGDCIFISTTGVNNVVDVANFGALVAGNNGIEASTVGNGAAITIFNGGDISAVDTTPAFDSDGVSARTNGALSGIIITNSGDITVVGKENLDVTDPQNPFSIGRYDGIYALTVGGDSPIRIISGGHITSSFGEAIDVRTYGGASPVTIINSGDIDSDDDGIEVCTAGTPGTNCLGPGGGESPVLLINSGSINAGFVPLDAVTYGSDSPITFSNTGDVVAGEEGLDAETSGDRSSILIFNSGRIETGIDGISAATSAYARGDASPISIVNSGDITAGEAGIYASTGQNFPSNNSPIAITNSGDIVAGLNGAPDPDSGGDGIYAHTNGTGSGILITTSGDITSGAGFSGIYAIAKDADSPITIRNRGKVMGGVTGILASSEAGISVTNSGTIAAANGTAIRFDGDSSDTLTLLPGSNIQGTIDLGGGDDTLIVGNGLSIASTFTGGPEVIHAQGAPLAVSGNLVAVADPTVFALEDEVAADLTGAITNAIHDRLQDRGGLSIGPSIAATVPPATPMRLGMRTGAVAAAPNDAGNRGWGTLFGSVRNQEGDAPSVGAEYRLGGVIAGLDGGLPGGLGAFLGASTGEVAIDFGSQAVDIDSVFGGLYARYHSGRWILDFALTAGATEHDSERRIANNLAPGGIETAKATFNGAFVAPEIAVGTTLRAGDVEIVPSVRARYAGLFLDGYRETGSVGAIAVGDRDVQLLVSRAQVAFAKSTIAEGGGLLVSDLRLGIEGRTNLGDDEIGATLLGQQVTIEPGGSGEAGAIFAGFGIGYDFPGSAVSLGAGGEAKVETDGAVQGAGHMGLKIRF